MTVIYTDRFRKPREKLKLAFRRSIEAEEAKARYEAMGITVVTLDEVLFGDIPPDDAA